MAFADGQIFNTIDAIGNAITRASEGNFDKFAHSGNFTSDFILIIFAFVLSAEIIMCLLNAMGGSGQQAIQRGVESILIATLIFSLTSKPVWTDTVKPIFKGISDEAIKTLGQDPNSLKKTLAGTAADSIKAAMGFVPESTRKKYEVPGASGVPATP